MLTKELALGDTLFVVWKQDSQEKHTLEVDGETWYRYNIQPNNVLYEALVVGKIKTTVEGDVIDTYNEAGIAYTVIISRVIIGEEEIGSRVTVYSGDEESFHTEEEAMEFTNADEAA